MCDSRVTEEGFDFATFDVNKICLKCIFYSCLACAEGAEIWCNCEGFIGYSALKERPALAQMECAFLPKCEVHSW